MNQNRINQESYSAASITASCVRFRSAVSDLVQRSPELSLIDQFDKIPRRIDDPLQEVDTLLETCVELFEDLKHLLNPIGLPIRMTDGGRVGTRTLQDVAVFVTDIRGFTEMTQQVQQRWGVNVFDLLSYCYFPHVVDVLERYECHYLNYTGDGMLVLSRERRDEKGRIGLSALDNAALCAIEMIAATNCIAETWKRMGMVQSSGAWHETGLGLSSGSVQVGDPFVPDQTPGGKLAEFDALFRGLAAEAHSFAEPRSEYNGRVKGIHALSPVINRASRLQDADKIAPEHTCMMTETDVQLLSPVLRPLFEKVGTIPLKGIGDADVFGFHRFSTIDVRRLEAECRSLSGL